ncbi:sodium-neurotransmitter symporter-like protein [Euroglyphus maynei]|uniref:Sodium-neurotransmitter symporter-like protein n=1 Tax=Euroglyphus maynei TaxID=6958 RepID=A0A1Y3AZD3_EURMA|nr:sodium-neurotransmitter symporter-like protein [Euroglyphus maynei]
MVLAFVCFVMFLAGLPMCTGAGLYILQLMDTYSVPYSAFFIAIVELIAIFWVYGLDIHMKNIYRMIGYKIWPQFYWRFMFKYGCPALICFMLAVVILRHEPLTYNDYVFPKYSEYVGWTLTASSVLLIPLFAILELVKVLRKRKTLQK